MNSGYIIKEITPLSKADCFYVADRIKSEFVYPLHSHKEFELNYIENAEGAGIILKTILSTKIRVNGIGVYLKMENQI